MVLILIIFFAAVLDLLVKAAVEMKFAVGEKRQLGNKPVYLWHIKNRGVAYNCLDGKRKHVILFSFTAMLALFINLLDETHKNGYNIKNISLSLMLGGGLGNFLERIKKGFVTDYIYIKARKAPIFNIADVFILLGSIIFCLSSVFGKEKL